MITIHHAGIVVSDLDRSIDFYTAVLGLELMTEPTTPAGGPLAEAALQLPGAILRGAFLRAGDSAIELLEFSAPPAPSAQVMPAHALGAQHVALQVGDLVAERAAVQSRGGGFVNEINVIDEGPLAGLRTTCLLDPDGVRVELVEVAYWRTSERTAAIDQYWRARAAR